MAPLSEKGRRYMHLLLYAAAAIIAFFVITKFNLIVKHFKGSVDVEQVLLPTATSNAKTIGLTQLPLPSTTVSSKPTTSKFDNLRVEQPEWNATLGLQESNGGPETTTGSLMEQYSIHLTLIRQDNDGTSQDHLIKTAEDYSEGKDISGDIAGFIDMGDGGGPLIATINAKVKKFGMKAKVIVAFGKSGNALSGEDGFWAPPAWRANHDLARGGLIAAQQFNGDWNIMVQWCHDNHIAFNRDPKTFCRTSLNFVATDTYQAAGDLYIAGTPIKRTLVDSTGKSIGGDTTLAAQGYCSWTPVDENVSTKKGGVVKLISTKEYSNQMYCVFIGLDKIMADHPETYKRFIEAGLAGGDQVKTYSAALDNAGEIAAKIYNDKDGKYWVRYSKGVIGATDKTGLVVDLGGSTQFNLGDAAFGFGIPSGVNIYSIVYTNFRDKIDLGMYPEAYKDTPIPTADDAIDLTYLQAAYKDAGTKVSAPSVATYSGGSTISDIASKANYDIKFNFNSIELSPSGIAQVENLNEALINAGSQKITINAYTDNVGSDDQNMKVSQGRADAIKNYLQNKYGKDLYPDSRIFAIPHGSGDPIASNATKAGQAKNRRVQIIVGN